MIDWIRVDCPYCGERFDTAFDTSAGDTVLVEDCAICCKPILLSVTLDAEGDAQVRAHRENE